MKGSDEDEVRKILAQFGEDMHKVDAKLLEQRDSQRDALLARLAARKRMKEDLNKEEAVATELDRITKIQVDTQLKAYMRFGGLFFMGFVG